MGHPIHHVSYATAHGHAGELLQGAIQLEGKEHYFLVSLPVPALQSRAVFHPLPQDRLDVLPIWKHKSLRAARLMLEELGSPHQGGVLQLSDEIPASRGFGSSTGDCIAAMRAVAAHFRMDPAPAQLAALAHRAEHASDGTMFPEQLTAFLQCEGRLHEIFEGPIPQLNLLAVEPAGPFAPVYTNQVRRPSYSAQQIDSFSELIHRLRTAIAEEDLHAIGAVASASAEIHQQHFPHPHYDLVAEVASTTNALGIAAAHTGSILTLLYPANGSADRIDQACAQLSAHSLHNVHELSTWSGAFN